MTTTIPDVLAQQVLSAVRDRRRAMAFFLRELVLAESPSTAPASQGRVLRLLATALNQIGFTATTFRGKDSGPHLYARPARRKRGQPIQLLMGHCDTVWPKGTLGEMPLRVEADRLYGPGAYDMKGGLVQMVYALQVLYTLHKYPPVLPVVFINSDEEIGSRSSTRFIRRLAQIADRAYVLEPSLGPSGKLKVARKGVGRFTVVVHGKAAHAGLDPGQGASAILELAHVVQRLHALNDPERGITVNVGQIEGGIRPNVVAPESRAVIDVRVPTSEDATHIEQAILRMQPTTPGVTLEVTGGIGRPPMVQTPRNLRLWEAAQALGLQLGLHLEAGQAGGGSDGNTASLHTATLDGLGGVGEGAHAAHEHVQLDQMVERTALLALLILKEPLRGPSQGG